VCAQVDFVRAVAAALNREDARGSYLEHPAAAYVNMLIVPEGSTVLVDEEALAKMGVANIKYVASHRDTQGRSFFDPDKLVTCLKETFEDTPVTPAPP
jgi:hypothetical protein